MEYEDPGRKGREQLEKNKEILEQTARYFKEKQDQYGATVKGLDWNSEEAQSIRFQQLEKLIAGEEKAEFSICDYGCGYGDFFVYLQEKGYRCRYTGVDLVEETIACAKRKFGQNREVVLLQGTTLEQTYDYIVASGIFNLKGTVENEEWKRYMLGILKEFHSHSKKGFAFNCLTSYSDAEYMRDDLYYADPLFWFDYAKKHFSRNVALLHDYELYDFTVLVRK